MRILLLTIFILLTSTARPVLSNSNPTGSELNAQFSEFREKRKDFLEKCLSKGIRIFLPCLHDFESNQIKEYQQSVQRDSENLILNLNNGKRKTFEDEYRISKSSKGERFWEGCRVCYEFQLYLKNFDLFIVAKHYYEGGDTLLINGNSGAETGLLGEYYGTLFSPDGNKFVSYQGFDESGYSREGIEIWRIQKNELIMEYSDTKIGYLPTVT